MSAIFNQELNKYKETFQISEIQINMQWSKLKDFNVTNMIQKQQITQYFSSFSTKESQLLITKLSLDFIEKRALWLYFWL